jgi:hypothetical protein
MSTLQVLLDHNTSTVFPTRYWEIGSLELFRSEKMEFAPENDMATVGAYVRVTRDLELSPFFNTSQKKTTENSSTEM